MFRSFFTCDPRTMISPHILIAKQGT
jgi:hypothetical protein